MIWGRKRYVRVAPAGSVLPNAFRLLRLALSKARKSPGGTIANIRSDQFWQKVKPSAVAAETGETPKWMTFDDRKCAFCCNPLYVIALILGYLGRMGRGSPPRFQGLLGLCPHSSFLGLLQSDDL